MKSGRVSFPPAPYLWIQALLALVAIVVAYLLTIALSIACLVLPLLAFWSFVNSGLSYQNWQGFLRAMGTPLLGCLAVGGIGVCVMSLWSLFPRRAPFQAPGPRLSPIDQGRLFSEIRSIAEMFGIPVPGEVYLCGDMAILVAERNGFFGFGRGQILVVGLPALQLLTVGQFRAMVAAGSAHLYAGDTALNPWINTLMSAMARVLNSSKPAPPAGPLSAFFLAYGGPIRLALASSISVYWKLLLRLCQGLTLRLERRADALACYAAGTNAFVSGLRLMYRYWPASKFYWNVQVAPIVHAGFFPPLGEGFARFIGAPRLDQSSAEFLDTQMNRRERTPADPRPLLHDRIAAAPTHRVEREDSGSAAIALLEKTEETELRLLAHLFPGTASRPLLRIAWSDIGPAVYGPAWRALVAEHAGFLAGLNPQSLPGVMQDLSGFSARIPNPPGMLLSALQRTTRLRTVLQSALALVLMDSGWAFSAQAGELVFLKDEMRVNLSEELVGLETGRLAGETWLQRWRQWGLADVPLVSASTAAS